MKYEFDYSKITLEDIEMYSYYYFECDGDSKKVIVKLKKEEDSLESEVNKLC